jgi:hypothetical protein
MNVIFDHKNDARREMDMQVSNEMASYSPPDRNNDGTLDMRDVSGWKDTRTLTPAESERVRTNGHTIGSTGSEIERNQRSNEFLANSRDREYIAAASKAAEEERRLRKMEKKAEREQELEIRKIEREARKAEALGKKDTVAKESETLKVENEARKEKATVEKMEAEQRKKSLGRKPSLTSRASNFVGASLRQGRIDIANSTPGGITRSPTITGIRANGIAPPQAPANTRFYGMNAGAANFAASMMPARPMPTRARSQIPQPTVVQNPLSHFTNNVLGGGASQRKPQTVGTANRDAMKNLTNSILIGGANTTKRRDNPALMDKNIGHLKNDVMSGMMFGGKGKGASLPKMNQNFLGSMTGIPGIGSRQAPKNGGTIKPLQGVDLGKFNQQMLLGNKKPPRGNKPKYFGGGMF